MDASGRLWLTHWRGRRSLVDLFRGHSLTYLPITIRPPLGFPVDRSALLWRQIVDVRVLVELTMNRERPVSCAVRCISILYWRCHPGQPWDFQG